MRCPSCNYDNPADASFCEGCGTKLELICPACKASVSPGARFGSHDYQLRRGWVLERKLPPYFAPTSSATAAS
jgi:predicted amidophosphoribosyltransferase